VGQRDHPAGLPSQVFPLFPVIANALLEFPDFMPDLPPAFCCLRAEGPKFGRKRLGLFIKRCCDLFDLFSQLRKMRGIFRNCAQDEFLVLADQLLTDTQITHRTQAFCPTDLGGRPNQPFGHVIVIPADPVAIIAREGVVVIVIAFTKGQQRQNSIVHRRQFSGVSPRTPSMRERIDKPS